MLRQNNVHFHKHISILILLCVDGHSQSTKSELFTVCRPLCNIDCDFIFQRFDLSLSPEKSGVQFNGKVTVKIVSVPVKFRMRCNFDTEIEVAVWTAARSASSFAGNSQHLIICDAWFDRHLDRLTIELDEPRRAVIRFFKRKSCLCFKILAFKDNASSPSSLAAPLAKQCLKKIVDALVGKRLI